MPQRAAKQMFERVMKATRVLVVGHQHPDGDALGSVTALLQWLEKTGIPAQGFSSTPISPKLLFLPFAHHVTQDDKVWEKNGADAVIVCDSGDLGYAGIDAHLTKPDAPRVTIINVDHHVTNQRYGDINLVVPDAASTTEILYRFFVYNGVAIDRGMATSLLTGLVTDTDHFTNAATTPSAMRIASDLILKGADLETITARTVKDKTLPGLKLWGAILGRLKKHDRHDVAYTFITQHDIAQHNATEADTEGLPNFLSTLQDSRVGMLLKETNGSVKVSFRTTRDDTDVAKIAAALGGGGHRKAAGCTIMGKIDEALQEIWETIDLHGLEASGRTI